MCQESKKLCPAFSEFTHHEIHPIRACLELAIRHTQNPPHPLFLNISGPFYLFCLTLLPAHKALPSKSMPFLKRNVYLKALAQARGSPWLPCTVVPGAVRGAVGPKPQEEQSSATPPATWLQHRTQQLWRAQDLQSDRRLVKTPSRAVTLHKAAAEG